MTEASHGPVTSRRSFLSKAGAGAGSLALLAGLNLQAGAQDNSPVIVGGPLPLTGPIAADGVEFKRGLEMAAEEINALARRVVSWNRK